MKRTLLLYAFLLGLLAGCASPTAPPIPTPYPPEYLPTIIAMTAEGALVAATETANASIPTESPVASLEPTFTAPPALTATPLPTSTSTAIPEHKRAAIQILAPGPMSKVVSPIQLKMDVISGDSSTVQIDLYGEDGRLMSRELKRVIPNPTGSYQLIKIPFEILGAGELGRVTVSTTDKAGRIVALNSVHVLMISSGSNEITPAGNPFEAVGVFSPRLSEPAFGGVLTVRGDVWPFNLQPIIFELLGPDGQSISLRIVTVNGIQPQLFETEIPYKVSGPTLARLSIRQEDDRISGPFYVYSQEILLNP
ncbi:MAG: hypothetical protein HXY35_11250 [Chloroflexi bacterium]|nr:hypothetical protein [Chloroflexota bacterium]